MKRKIIITLVIVIVGIASYRFIATNPLGGARQPVSSITKQEIELALKNYVESEKLYADEIGLMALGNPELYANAVYEIINELEETSKLLKESIDPDYPHNLPRSKVSVLLDTVGFSSSRMGPNQKVFDLLIQSVMRLNEIEGATGGIDHYGAIQQYLMQSIASCRSDPTDLRPEFVRNLCKKNNNPDYLIQNSLGKYGSTMDKLLQADLGKYGK